MMDNAALSHFKKERQELDAQEVELREEVGKAEEKRRWFGDFKTFVEEVADFLDEKVGHRRTQPPHPISDDPDPFVFWHPVPRA